MKSFIFCCALFLGVTNLVVRADLYTPPTVDWVSIPDTASVGQSISVGVGAHANYSDNSDGNEYNWDTMPTIYRVMVDLITPDGITTRIYDWVDPWRSPAEIWTNFTVSAWGTHRIRVRVMDGREWYSDEYNYDFYVPSAQPAITSQLGFWFNQNQDVWYQITATNGPTSFSASDLPPGLSLDSSTGVISGRIPYGGSWSTTISASNGNETGWATVDFEVNSASMWVYCSASPGDVYNGDTVTLSREGASNFGIAMINNTVFPPNGSVIELGSTQVGSMDFLPTDGPGQYWYRTQLIDIYNNMTESWAGFTVISSVMSAPANVQPVVTGSSMVTLSWNAQPGVARFDIYRNGSYVGSTGDTRYTDSTASPLSSYNYLVYAVDSQNVFSGASVGVDVQTLRGLEVFTPLP